VESLSNHILWLYKFKIGLNSGTGLLFLPTYNPNQF
jgi:hypothetical protein